MTEDERVERAQKAAMLMQNPLLAEAFTHVRLAIIERLEQTPIRDRDGAHELRLMLKLLSDVRKALGQFVNDGKVVQFNQKQRLMDKVRSTLGVAKS